MATIRAKHMAHLCRRVGTSIGAGVDLQRAWQQEGGRGSQRQREAAQMVVRGIKQGDTLAEAMERTRGYYPSLVCEMIEAGEMTGQVDQIFLRIADQYEHAIRLRRTFLSGILWPAIELGIATIVIGIFIWVMGEVVPRMQDGSPVFDLLGIGVGNEGLRNYVGILALIVGAVVFIYYALTRSWFGPVPMALFMRTPLVGQSLQTLLLSRLAWTLAMANNAGMDARRSVALALRSTSNPYYTSKLKQVDRVIKRGDEIHDAFREAGVFPEEFMYVVENAEQSGTLPESLLRLANEYQQRAESSSNVLTVVATFIVMGLGFSILIMFIFRLAFFYLNAINPSTYGL